jgi:AcrR family transcriptional regulator
MADEGGGPTPAAGSTATPALRTRPATRPVTRRVTRKREDSRRRLIEAAKDAFAEHGIRDTPVEAICDRAGFTRGAFYSNFSSKEDLFLAVYEEEATRRQQAIAEVIASVVDLPLPDDVPALRAVVTDIARRYVTAHTGDETWFTLLTEFRLQGLRQPELRPRLEKLLRQNIDELTAVIQEFIARVGLRLAVDVRYVARVILALYDDALANNLIEGLPLTADNEFVTDVIPRLLSGLLDLPPTRPGRTTHDVPADDADVPAGGLTGG